MDRTSQDDTPPVSARAQGVLFDDDLQQRNTDRAQFLRAQVRALRGDLLGCRELLGAVMARDPNHRGALDLGHDLDDEEKR